MNILKEQLKLLNIYNLEKIQESNYVSTFVNWLVITAANIPISKRSVPAES